MAIQFEGLEDRHIYRCTSNDVYKQLIQREEVDVRFLPPKTIKVGKYVEITLKQLLNGNLFSFDSDVEMDLIPRVESNKNFTILNKLKTCLNHYKQVPILADENSATFYYPPILHKQVNKLVAMSATLNADHLQQAFLAKKYPF